MLELDTPYSGEVKIRLSEIQNLTADNPITISMLFHKHEGFVDFGEPQAVRFIADQGLRVTLVGDLFFQLRV